MLYTNSTLVKLFPTLLDSSPGSTADATALGLERWLYLTQALQAHCVGGSVSAYRQRASVMGSLNWAINSIWTAPAWGSISHDGSWKMLHYRLKHVFAPAMLSFVHPVLFVPGSSHNVPANSTCPPGGACLHLSNHRHAALAVAGCSLSVVRFENGETVHTSAFEPPTIGAVAGADVFNATVAELFAAGACGAGECFLAAGCEGGAAGAAGADEGSAGVAMPLVAQPYFPTPLSECVLAHANLSGTITASNASAVQLTLATNTTAPYVFLSSTIPGRFSDNSFTLLPGKQQARTLSFEYDEMPGSSSRGGAAARSNGDWIHALRVYTMNNKAPTAGADVFGG